MSKLSLFIATDVANFAACGWSANAQELRVYAAGATKEVVICLTTEFTRATGIKVGPVYDTVGALRDRLLRDLCITQKPPSGGS